MVSRFKGQYFRTDNFEIVSLWVATCPLKDIPRNYFVENYAGEDDDPFNDFSNDFGFGYYDHDFVETMADENQQEIVVEDLLSKLSYSKSFLAAALKAASAKGLKTSSCVIALYNFAYSPEVTKIESSKFMRFLAAVPFSSRE